MKFNFANQELFLRNQEIKTLVEIADLKGKFQFLEKEIKSLEEKSNALDEINKKLTERQEKEESYLLETSNSLSLKRMIIDLYSIYRGKKDSLVFLNEEEYFQDNFNIKVNLLTKDMEVIEKDVSYYRAGEGIYKDCGLKAKYSEICIKGEIPLYFKSLKILESSSKIKEIRYKDEDGSWISLPFNTYFIERQNESYINLLFSEVSIVLENKKINDRYCLETMVFHRKNNEKIPFSHEQVEIFNPNFLTFYQGDDESFCEVKVIDKEKEYDIQLPSSNLTISKLLPIVHVSTGSSISTIFKVPYPVKLDSPTELFFSLEEKDSVISSWEASLDLTSWTTDLSSLTYSSEYTKNPKYLYIRVPGYYELTYLSYTTERNIKCDWPISDDGKIFFSGDGVGIKELLSEKINISCSVYGRLHGEYINNYFILGLLGID